jgi:hypothetical protein
MSTQKGYLQPIARVPKRLTTVPVGSTVHG